jgi:Uma2 family endonuclease
MSARTSAATAPAEGPALSADDQRVVIHGVPWQTYSAIRELLDSPGLRMTYIEGTLELMTPSPLHELRKKTIARLVEVFALERDVPLVGYGSTTFRREAKERGLEPDECYVLGGELRDAPDIALEVVVKSGGIAKLPIYAGLGVREVWFFHNERFRLYRLDGDRYVEIAGSELVPALDFEVLAGFAVRPDQHQAVREYRDLLRAG